MLPPVFDILTTDTRTAEIVDRRIYGRGYAPQIAPNEPRPAYVSWFAVSGDPFNTLSERPGRDRVVVQVDCWHPTDAGVRRLAEAVRDAIEPHAHMTGMPVDGRDGVTKLWRQSLQFDFLVERPPFVPAS